MPLTCLWIPLELQNKSDIEQSHQHGYRLYNLQSALTLSHGNLMTGVGGQEGGNSQYLPFTDE